MQLAHTVGQAPGLTPSAPKLWESDGHLSLNSVRIATSNFWGTESLATLKHMCQSTDRISAIQNNQVAAESFSPCSPEHFKFNLSDEFFSIEMFDWWTK